MVRTATVLCQEFISIVFVLDEVGNLMFQDFIKHLKRTKRKRGKCQLSLSGTSKSQESLRVTPSDFKMSETKLFQGHSNVKVNFFLCGEHGGEKIE
jgi:hypothetical protein